MLNEIIVMGYIVREPVLRFAQNGDAVATFTIAVYRGKGRGADYFDCKAWKKTAEYINDFGRKGQLVVIRGRMELHEWIDRINIKHKIPELSVNDLCLCDRCKSGADPAEIDLDDLPGEPVADEKPN